MRKLLAAFAFLLMVSLSAPAQTQQPVRVNCGGPAYTDSSGNVWQADFGFNTGIVGGTSAIVTGTNDPKLYTTNRWNSSRSTPLIYSFTVLNGSYTVNLYFAETSGPEESVGARVFNVTIQGAVFLQNFDIFSQAGGANKALMKSTTATVTNGTLAIEFDDIIQNAVIQAIEIIPATTTPPPPTLTLNFTYPDGTPVAGTLGYGVTSTLLSFQGTAPLTNGQAQCVMLANPSTLGISTQFQVNLSLTDTSGNVLWQLTVGINPAAVNFGAIQSSALNVVVQKM